MAKKVDSGVCATIHKIQLIWPNWAKQLLKRHKNDDNEDPLLLIEWMNGTFGKVFSGKYHGRAVTWKTCDADKEKERKKR
ncbi:unnamed protein product [Rhizophagus irregularis]|nr:unnamed protein product [Rhizophagus irregularis]